MSKTEIIKAKTLIVVPDISYPFTSSKYHTQAITYLHDFIYAPSYTQCFTDNF